MADSRSGAESATAHLRTLLLGLGVGGKWSLRELARQSDRALTKDMLARMTAPIPAGQRGHRWKIESLQALADTLRSVGIAVTVGQLERAVMADLGYVSAASGDDLGDVLALVEGFSRADLARLLQEVAFLLAPDGAADQPRTRAPVFRADPPRG